LMVEQNCFHLPFKHRLCRERKFDKEALIPNVNSGLTDFEKLSLSFINEGDSIYIVTQPITENDQCDSHANHMLLPLNRKITE